MKLKNSDYAYLQNLLFIALSTIIICLIDNNVIIVLIFT